MRAATSPRTTGWRSSARPRERPAAGARRRRATWRPQAPLARRAPRHQAAHLEHRLPRRQLVDGTLEALEDAAAAVVGEAGHPVVVDEDEHLRRLGVVRQIPFELEAERAVDRGLGRAWLEDHDAVPRERRQAREVDRLAALLGL